MTRILVLGNSKSGKTTLSKLMVNREPPVNLSSESDVDSDLILEYDFSTEYHIWTVKRPHAKGTDTHYRRTDIALYCVDLSNSYDVLKIAEELSEFRNHNSDAPIVIVGTKKDVCGQDPEQLITSIRAEVHNKLLEDGLEGLAQAITFSALDEEDLAKLIKQVRSFLQEEKPPTHLLQNARDILPIQSQLYQAIDHFISTVEELELSEDQLTQLGKQTKGLIFNLQNPQCPTKDMAIETFAKNCHLILDGPPSIVANAIEGIVAAVLVSFFAFAVGFAIGCALGAWTGPFALLTGIATGSAAAVTLLSVSGGCGALIGGLTAFGVFKAPSVGSQAINELKVAAMDSF